MLATRQVTPTHLTASAGVAARPMTVVPDRAPREQPGGDSGRATRRAVATGRPCSRRSARGGGGPRGQRVPHLIPPQPALASQIVQQPQSRSSILSCPEPSSAQAALVFEGANIRTDPSGRWLSFSVRAWRRTPIASTANTKRAGPAWATTRPCSCFSPRRSTDRDSGGRLHRFAPVLSQTGLLTLPGSTASTNIDTGRRLLHHAPTASVHYGIGIRTLPRGRGQRL